MQVLQLFQNNILNRVIIEIQTDFTNHPYYIVWDIGKLHSISEKFWTRTKMVNIYDNKIGEWYLW